ncbi:hypothetical protein [uncultured Anaeromusa sp.]|uniref:hypothetical protein n=1 Tax=uncultured Anaeromusa sp. TaxID=673273 RepID=UPI0029C7284E|nr:hypothetical protein [uncultured Anaeromusa sp.]
MTNIYDLNNHQTSDLVNFYNQVSPCGYYWSDYTELTDAPVINALRAKWVNPLQAPLTEQKKRDRLPPAFMTFIHLGSNSNSSFDEDQILPDDDWILPDKFIPFVDTYGRLIPLNASTEKQQHRIFYMNEYLDMKHAYNIKLKAKANHPISFSGTLAFTDVLTPDIDSMFARLSEQNLLKNTPQTTYQEYPFDVDIDGQGTSFFSKIDKVIVSYEEDVTINNINDLLTLKLIMKSDPSWSISLTPTTYLFDDKITIMSNDVQACPDIKSLSLMWLTSFVATKAAKYPSSYAQKYNPKSQKWSPTVRPSSLLAAMWYQFGEWVAGYRKYKWCPFCDTWQDVTKSKSSWEMHKDCASKARVQKSREKKKKKEYIAQLMDILITLTKKDDDNNGRID